MLKLLDRIMPWLFWLSLAFIMMTAGMAAGYFNAWPAPYYDALDAYVTRILSPSKKPDAKQAEAVLLLHRPEKAFRGHTLVTGQDHVVSLLDMDGKKVFRWRASYQKLWGKRTPDMGRKPPYVAQARLLPNGDILVMHHLGSDRIPLFYGIGITRLDRHSNIVWQTAMPAHDSLYLGENGSIYTLSHSVNAAPVPGLNYARPPHLLDDILILAPDGRVEKQLPVLPAFIGTPYEPLLYVSGTNRKYAHANSVMPLEKSLADAFPGFRAGDLLVSLSHLDTIAVIRPETGKVVWAARGMWRRQSSARFMADGTIMLFDPQGYYDGSGAPRPRILRVEPMTQAVRWVYVDKDMPQGAQPPEGMQQALPNGNVLYTRNKGGRIVEVTPEKEKAWEYRLPEPITGVQRVPYDYLDKSFWGAPAP